MIALIAICFRNIALIALIVRAIRSLCGHTGCPKTITSQMWKKILFIGSVPAHMKSAAFHTNNFKTLDAKHAKIFPSGSHKHICLSQNTGCNRTRKQTEKQAA